MEQHDTESTGHDAETGTTDAGTTHAGATQVGTGAGTGPAPDAEPPAGSRGGLVLAGVLYVGARLALVAVITVVLALLGLPVLVSLLVAIVAALPLSLVLFRGLRARLARETEVATASRRERRERLRAELRGDVPPETADVPPDTADGTTR